MFNNSQSQVPYNSSQNISLQLGNNRHNGQQGMTQMSNPCWSPPVFNSPKSKTTNNGILSQSQHPSPILQNNSFQSRSPLSPQNTYQGMGNQLQVQQNNSNIGGSNSLVWTQQGGLNISSGYKSLTQIQAEAMQKQMQQQQQVGNYVDMSQLQQPASANASSPFSSILNKGNSQSWDILENIKDGLQNKQSHPQNLSQLSIPINDIQKELSKLSESVNQVSQQIAQSKDEKMSEEHSNNNCEEQLQSIMGSMQEIKEAVGTLNSIVEKQAQDCISQTEEMKTQLQQFHSWAQQQQKQLEDLKQVKDAVVQVHGYVVEMSTNMLDLKSIAEAFRVWKSQLEVGIDTQGRKLTRISMMLHADISSSQQQQHHNLNCSEQKYINIGQQNKFSRQPPTVQEEEQNLNLDSSGQQIGVGNPNKILTKQVVDYEDSNFTTNSNKKQEKYINLNELHLNRGERCYNNNNNNNDENIQQHDNNYQPSQFSIVNNINNELYQFIMRSPKQFQEYSTSRQRQCASKHINNNDNNDDVISQSKILPNFCKNDSQHGDQNFYYNQQDLHKNEQKQKLKEINKIVPDQKKGNIKNTIQNNSNICNEQNIISQNQKFKKYTFNQNDENQIQHDNISHKQYYQISNIQQQQQQIKQFDIQRNESQECRQPYPPKQYDNILANIIKQQKQFLKFQNTSIQKSSGQTLKQKLDELNPNYPNQNEVSNTYKKQVSNCVEKQNYFQSNMKQQLGELGTKNFNEISSNNNLFCCSKQNNSGQTLRQQIDEFDNKNQQNKNINISPMHQNQYQIKQQTGFYKQKQINIPRYSIQISSSTDQHGQNCAAFQQNFCQNLHSNNNSQKFKQFQKNCDKTRNNNNNINKNNNLLDKKSQFQVLDKNFENNAQRTKKFDEQKNKNKINPKIEKQVGDKNNILKPVNCNANQIFNQNKYSNVKQNIDSLNKKNQQQIVKNIEIENNVSLKAIKSKTQIIARNDTTQFQQNPQQKDDYKNGNNKDKEKFVRRKLVFTEKQNKNKINAQIDKTCEQKQLIGASTKQNMEVQEKFIKGENFNSCRSDGQKQKKFKKGKEDDTFKNCWLDTSNKTPAKRPRQQQTITFSRKRRGGVLNRIQTN